MTPRSHAMLTRRTAARRAGRRRPDAAWPWPRTSAAREEFIQDLGNRTLAVLDQPTGRRPRS